MEKWNVLGIILSYSTKFNSTNHKTLWPNLSVWVLPHGMKKVATSGFRLRWQASFIFPFFSIFRDVCQPKAMYGHLESLFGSFWRCAGKGLSHCWLILVSQIIFHLFLKKECIGTVWINGKFTLSFGWKIFREINWQYFALALQNRLLSRKGEWIFDIVTLDNRPKTEVVSWKSIFLNDLLSFFVAEVLQNAEHAYYNEGLQVSSVFHICLLF